MKKDLLPRLEKLHFETAMGLEDIAARLAPLLRLQRLLYRSIVAAHSKKSNRLLCQLIACENAPKRKAAKGNGGHRPGARKGAKRGSP